MSENIIAAICFIGRIREADALLRAAKGQGSKRGILLLSAPVLGASELLKQTFNRRYLDTV